MKQQEFFNSSNKEIEDSKHRILSLKDNWDGEGSKGYKKETWNQSINFLRQLTKEIEA